MDGNRGYGNGGSSSHGADFARKHDDIKLTKEETEFLEKQFLKYLSQEMEKNSSNWNQFYDILKEETTSGASGRQADGIDGSNHETATQGSSKASQDTSNQHNKGFKVNTEKTKQQYRGTNNEEQSKWKNKQNQTTNHASQQKHHTEQRNSQQQKAQKEQPNTDNCPFSSTENNKSTKKSKTKKGRKAETEKERPRAKQKHSAKTPTANSQQNTSSTPKKSTKTDKKKIVEDPAPSTNIVVKILRIIKEVLIIFACFALMILLFALKFLWAVSKKILKYTLLLILYVVATLLGFCMMLNQRYQIITKLINFTNNALEVIHLVLGIDLKGWFRRRGNRSSTKSTFDDGPPPPLPENSEKAIQFLLKENPDRPYRILCVSNTDSVDQIRNHYRKLVRLVHPDKCNLPQAEDAFKVLDTAFKKLADPEKREEINSEMERQKAWDEFNKNMSEDYKNMFEELLNTIQCSSCEKRHKKTLVEKRTFMEARFCAECNTKHPAEDGDVWAEVGMLGVNWTCYACFDGEVYEITDWGKCQNLKQAIPVNHHRVFCHVGTQAANKSGRSRTPRNSEESGNRGTKRSKKNKRRK